SDRLWQRIIEVLVLAAPEIVLLHDHTAAEARLVVVQFGQSTAGGSVQQAQRGVALRGEVGRSVRPIDGGERLAWHGVQHSPSVARCTLRILLWHTTGGQPYSDLRWWMSGLSRSGCIN